VTDDDGEHGEMGFMEMFRILGSRPQCEHNLNGPCRECGRGMTLAEEFAWQRELEELGTRSDDDNGSER
jgi:hypothetical protein